MIFLGLASGLTRPQTIKALKKSGELTQDLNQGELIYSIINFVFLIVGGYTYQWFNFNGPLFIATLLLCIYCIIQLYFRRKNNENSITF